MASLADFLNRTIQQVQASISNVLQNQSSSRPPSNIQNNNPTQANIDAQHVGRYNPLFHGADVFSQTSPALERLQTKKVWEKPIGGKFNINDEVNQIAQQKQLERIGYQQLQYPEERARQDQRKGWHQ